MIDGTYRIEIELLLGRKQGLVTLRTEGDVVIAEIEIPIIGKIQGEGQLEGDTFTTEGSIKLKLLGEIDYKVKGEVIGDKLLLDIESNKGNFLLEGERV